MGLIFRGQSVSLKTIPIGRELSLPKYQTILETDFEETPLGHLHGAIRQYRGPFQTHVREYLDRYVVHRDRVDPRIDPLGHLICDAPDDLVGLALGGTLAIGAGKWVYDERKGSSDTALFESVVVAAVVGTVGYAVGKWIGNMLKGD